MIKCKLINGTAWHPLYISVFNCSHHCCMDRAVHPCPYMTASHAFVKKNRLSPNLFKTTNRSNPLLHILPLARCRVFKSEPAFYYGRVLAIYKRWISELEGCLRRGPRPGYINAASQTWKGVFEEVRAQLDVKTFQSVFDVYGLDQVKSERNKKKTWRLNHKCLFQDKYILFQKEFLKLVMLDMKTMAKWCPKMHWNPRGVPCI